MRATQRIASCLSGFAIEQVAGPTGAARILAWLGIGLAAALLGGCANGDGISFLHPHGMIADAQRRWLIDILLWMAIVVVPVLLLVPLFAWHYRRRNTSATYRPDWEFSWPIEFVVWGIPALIVVVLAFLIIDRQTPLDPYRSIASKNPPLEIEVIALDWKWMFIYPGQHIATVSTLVIPQDRPIAFHLTSDSNMQSFFIPALGSQIYAMAGMVTQLHLIADLPGTLMGENTQYNGDKFQDEKFDVRVLAPAAFDQWATSRQADGIAFDPKAYDKLSARGNTVDAKKEFGLKPADALSFKSVDPSFFASIVDKYNPGAMSMAGHDMKSMP